VHGGNAALLASDDLRRACARFGLESFGDVLAAPRRPLSAWEVSFVLSLAALICPNVDHSWKRTAVEAHPPSRRQREILHDIVAKAQGGARSGAAHASAGEGAAVAARASMGASATATASGAGMSAGAGAGASARAVAGAHAGASAGAGAASARASVGAREGAGAVAAARV
jgi:hypothetical protein